MKNFDFIGRSKIWAIISSTLILASIISLIFIGLHFSVEFTGGTSIEVIFKKRPSTSEIRKEISKIGLENSIIQPVGNKNMFIRFSKSDYKTQKSIMKVFEDKFGINSDAMSVEQVGPEWGTVIKNAALLALLLSIGALLIYISIRFEFKMAVSALVALLHDIIITLGVYALTGRDVAPATVAAVLTIMGYSLYDTIVVFHKIVENSKNIQKESYGSMVNRSVNQVLVRSINTSITSVLPVFAVLLFGGETLKDFAFALLIGLVSGTYSSIFVASPLLAFWKEFEPRYANLKRKYA